MTLQHSLVLTFGALVLAGCASSGQQAPAQDPDNSPFANEEESQGMESSGQPERERLSPSPLEQQIERRPDARLLHFEFDKAAIDPRYQELLKQHAEYLREHPEAVVRLEGHADERGTREYNMALGERRAFSVERSLRAMGVTEEQLTTMSYGEEKPMVVGSDEQSYQANRRVEIVYDDAVRQASAAGQRASY